MFLIFMTNNRKIIYLYISSTFIFLIKINVCLMTPIDVKSNKFCKNAIFSFLKEVESAGILLRTRTKKNWEKHRVFVISSCICMTRCIDKSSMLMILCQMLHKIMNRNFIFDSKINCMTKANRKCSIHPKGYRRHPGCHYNSSFPGNKVFINVFWVLIKFKRKLISLNIIYILKMYIVKKIRLHC